MPRRQKIIRDPVHDVIAFQLDRPVDQLLFRLLNAAEFQRLRRIQQLGMASLAYPGATHSRYSHSLGVMETARKMLARLRLSYAIDEQAETVLLAAALLHDLGHGPFSHVFEHVSGIEHEKLTQRIIADSQSRAHQILAAHDRDLPGMVLRFLRCDPKRTFLNDVLASQLDADRFDYLLRDNLMTGSRYGDYDLTWLLHALTVDAAGDRIAVTSKSVSAAEAYLQSRYHMYRNVYFHKVVRSAEGMVKLALQRARRLAVQGRLQWPPRDHPVYKALLGQRLTIDEFIDLDDVSVTHCFKLWAHAEADAALAGLCRGLLFREVYKTIDLSHLDSAQAATRATAAQRAIDAAGGESAYDLFYDEPMDSPYEASYEPEQCPEGNGIFVVSDSGTGAAAELSACSPLPAALHRRLAFRRLHVRGAWADAARAAVRGE
jgi:HD superfamily phosphohydrolase